MQMAYNTGNDTRRLSSEILKAGIEAVNPKFNVAVVAMPWPVLLGHPRAGKAARSTSAAGSRTIHDPHNWVQPFLYSQGAYGRVINMTPEYAAKYDELILKGATTTDPEARRTIYEEIQLTAQEDAVVIWMYQELDGMHFQTVDQGLLLQPGLLQAATPGSMRCPRWRPKVTRLCRASGA